MVLGGVMYDGTGDCFDGVDGGEFGGGEGFEQFEPADFAAFAAAFKPRDEKGVAVVEVGRVREADDGDTGGVKE